MAGRICDRKSGRGRGAIMVEDMQPERCCGQTRKDNIKPASKTQVHGARTGIKTKVRCAFSTVSTVEQQHLILERQSFESLRHWRLIIEFQGQPPFFHIEVFNSLYGIRSAPWR